MLKKLQEDFLSSLEVEGNWPEQVSSNYPLERFAVYRHNVWYNLKHTLYLIYPGVWRLLGQECADNLGFAFVSSKCNWPIFGCLDEWGADFPAFLSRIPELVSLPYIADFAQYELLKHYAYRAKEASAMTATDLQQIPVEEISQYRFSFVPTCYIFKSRYPINLIEDLLEDHDKPPVSLDAGPSFAVVTRVDLRVTIYWVGEGEYAFFAAINSGRGLEEAANIAQKSHEFDLTEALSFLLSKCLLLKN